LDDQVIAALKANPTFTPLTANDMDGEISIGENKIRPNTNSVDGDGNRCFFYADKMTFYGKRKYDPEDVYGVVQPAEMMKREDMYGDSKKFLDELYMYLQNTLVSSGISLDVVQKQMQRGWFYLVYTGGEEAPKEIKPVKGKAAPKEKVVKKKSPRTKAKPVAVENVSTQMPPLETLNITLPQTKKEKKPRNKKE
jgi:hypothetical protein